MEDLPDLRTLAENTGAIRRCPHHDHVSLQGRAEAIAFAFFLVGQNKSRLEALQTIIRGAEMKCPECRS